MDKFMSIAYNEALKAYKKDDVPIGAVIVRHNKVVAKTYNQKENKRITTKHAEIIAIEKACKKLKTWHLDDCEIYVTMEPCLMCYGAIEQSRIKIIKYGINNQNFGFNSKYNIKSKILIKKVAIASDYIDYIKLFFKEKRKND